MKDPYIVLGISRDASDEEIKKAYHALARKYHPDNYMNSPLADEVEEKMKEINEAYDYIMKHRNEAKNGAYGRKTYRDDINFAEIRTLINSSRFSEADATLDTVAVSDRNAEWNFLKGCVLTHKGWYYDAQKYYETACYMDPENAEYREALNALKHARTSRGYRTDEGRASSGLCDICSALMCADCCCECMGGDLIRCC